MSQQIKQPFDSKMTVILLNRIMVMDEPYLSTLAQSVGRQIGAIQRYLDTMNERNWIKKEKQGRRNIYSIQPKHIWADSDELLYIDFAKWDDLDDDVREFLEFATYYKLRSAVATTDEKPDEEGETQWVRGTQIGDEEEELVWIGTNTTLRSILQYISNTIHTINLTAKELDISDLYRIRLREARHSVFVRSYINFVRGEWDRDYLYDEIL